MVYDKNISWYRSTYYGAALTSSNFISLINQGTIIDVASSTVFKHKDYRFIFLFVLEPTQDRSLMNKNQMNADGTVRFPIPNGRGDGTTFMANLLTNVFMQLINE